MPSFSQAVVTTDIDGHVVQLERAASWMVTLVRCASDLSTSETLLAKGDVIGMMHSVSSDSLDVEWWTATVSDTQPVAPGAKVRTLYYVKWKGWSYLHKTGTGQDLPPRSTGFNDIGIMTAPDGTSYAVAVMIGSTTVGIPERWALMQAVAKAVVAHLEPIQLKYAEVKDSTMAQRVQGAGRASQGVFCM